MRIWIERAAFVLLLILAGVGLWFGYHLSSRPAELKVAVGPPEREDHALLSGLSRRLANAKAPVRLQVVSQPGSVEAARALDRGEVDLAVIRADVSVPNSARALAIMQKHAVIVVATDRTKKALEDFSDLKERKLGIIGSPGANDQLIDRLLIHSGLAPTAVTRVPLTRETLVEAIRRGQVDAVLITGPLNGATVASFNAAAARAFRGAPPFIELDAEAIAKTAPEYTAEEIPAGAFRSAPMVPAEGLPTLFFDQLLVATTKLSDEHATALTRLIFESRVPLQAEYPTARLMQAASTEKDAAVPVHPGAAAYYNGEEKNFFERYGDALFYGPMLLSLVGTAGLATYRYLTRDRTFVLTDRFTRLRTIVRGAARAQSLDELGKLEDELSAMFDELVERLARGGLDESEISTAILIFKHVSDALGERRRTLAGSAPAAATPPAAPAAATHAPT
jgi:TRAP transporter TAXI family solute receptor